MPQTMDRTSSESTGNSSRHNRLVDRVLGWPRQTKRLLMFLADLVVIPTALWLAFALKFDSLSEGFERNPLFYVGRRGGEHRSSSPAAACTASVVRFIGARMLASILAGVTGSALVLWLLSYALPFVQQIPVSVAVDLLAHRVRLGHGDAPDRTLAADAVRRRRRARRDLWRGRRRGAPRDGARAGPAVPAARLRGREAVAAGHAR